MHLLRNSEKYGYFSDWKINISSSSKSTKTFLKPIKAIYERQKSLAYLTSLLLISFRAKNSEIVLKYSKEKEVISEYFLSLDLLAEIFDFIKTRISKISLLFFLCWYNFN